MEIKTFRAKTMPQALDLVRRELGPEAMVLHTRELHGSLLGRVFLGRQYEIAATPTARPTALSTPQAPSPWRGGLGRGDAGAVAYHSEELPNAEYGVLSTQYSAFPNQPRPQADAPLTLENRSATPSPRVAEFQSLLEHLRARGGATPEREMPPGLFDVFTDLIEADVDEDSARDLIDRLRREPSPDLDRPLAARARLAKLIEAELRVAGPVQITPGAARVVALIGPTGVGKTTTIAKLAANFRLRENRRVGLITVDTYRIAAVEQLRTYADIIDLPMKVVSTPREMREAVDDMRSFDLVLMDTAGRSPRDEVKIRELRSMLAEAAPHEVHLVLSATGAARSLAAVAEKFAPVGVTSLLVTKLDEATGLGNLLSLSRAADLPFSYLTDGQNVPDDIAVADSRRLAQLILNLQSGQWAAGSGQ